jgi:tetratricopeptide (TPR) repeat protein
LPAIFISHSSKDDEQANAIKAWLATDGYEQVFLDFDKHSGLRAGEEWERRLYEEIQRSHAVLLVLTPNWLDSKWCFAEFTQARALGKILFPLVLSPLGDRRVAPEIQGIDLRDWNADGEAYLRKRIREVVAELAHGFTWDQTRCPYPGIYSFDQQDAAIFFGRDREIREILEKLQARRVQGGKRFVLVLGNSGSGKSSVLKAGVLPQLARQPRDWLLLPTFRPEHDPVANFAKALATFCGGPAAWRDWEQKLLKPDARRTLQEIADDLRIGPAAGATIIVPIDQFEETFTIADPGKREAFLNILAVMADGTHNLPYLAVGTARSDVFNDLLKQKRGLLAVEDYPLPPMPIDCLPKIIEGPAGIAAILVDKGLAARIVADVKSTEALPLLAFALRELHERFAQEHKLTIANYESLGDPGPYRSPGSRLSPIENVVRRKAENVLELMAPSESELVALKGAFIPHLVRIRDDGTYVRQPAPPSDFSPEAIRLVDAFVDARLLTRRRDSEASANLIEVSHEALFKAWPLLAGWLISERDFLAGKSQLAQALAAWNTAPAKLKHEALLQGLALRRAQEWYRTRRSGLSKSESDFIEASQQALRVRNAKRIGIGVLGVVMAIGMAAPSLYAEYVRRTALQCDLYAAEPINNVHVPGVEFDKIIPDMAIPACTQAVKAQPENPRLMENLARSLDRGGKPEEAVAWYEKASAMNWASAQNSLGVMLLTGKGVELDYARGIELIRTAAQHNDPDAVGNYTVTDLAPALANRRAIVVILQRSLVSKGKLTETEVTGTWTPATQSALNSFKQSVGLNHDGLTPEVMDRLGVVEEIASAIRRERSAMRPQ